jgi:tetratricopeptide (TPR) repeat protein
MKKLIVFISACLLAFSLPVCAQKAPKWVEKARKAVISVTAFDKDNRPIGSAAGFYVSETGEALSAYSLFDGAARASVTDADGNTLPVASVIGADDLYDVVRFRVSVPKKVPFLPLAPDPVAAGSPVFLLTSPAAGRAALKQGSVVEAGKLKDPYCYYTVSFALEAGEANAPLLLPAGQVFALAQEDASGKNVRSYGVSASYVQSLRCSPADLFNTVYTRIGIRKAWPEDVEQASISLFLTAGTQDAAAYLETLNDFIATFPKHPEGYLSRASHYASRRAALASEGESPSLYLDRAMADLQTAARLSRNKGEMHYSRANLIYAVAADTLPAGPAWSMEAALEAVREAIGENDLPVYRELEGDIYFFLEDFPAAYEAYCKAQTGEAVSFNAFYLAAKALEKIPGAQISDLIVLLDSALVRMGDPLPGDAAPFVLERVEYKVQLGLFAEAVEDYNLYYALTDGKVNDSFYFHREQARFRSGDNEGALKDIATAIALNAGEPDYYAEEAAIYVRMQQYAEGLRSVEKALELAPDFAACYRIRGVCLVRSGRNEEACEAFGKARELGDPVVARLIREYCR